MWKYSSDTYSSEPLNTSFVTCGDSDERKCHIPNLSLNDDTDYLVCSKNTFPSTPNVSSGDVLFGYWKGVTGDVVFSSWGNLADEPELLVHTVQCDDNSDPSVYTSYPVERFFALPIVWEFKEAVVHPMSEGKVTVYYPCDSTQNTAMVQMCDTDYDIRSGMVDGNIAYMLCIKRDTQNDGGYDFVHTDSEVCSVDLRDGYVSSLNCVDYDNPVSPLDASGWRLLEHGWLTTHLGLENDPDNPQIRYVYEGWHDPITLTKTSCMDVRFVTIASDHTIAAGNCNDTVHAWHLRNNNGNWSLDPSPSVVVSGLNNSVLRMVYDQQCATCPIIVFLEDGAMYMSYDRGNTWRADITGLAVFDWGWDTLRVMYDTYSVAEISTVLSEGHYLGVMIYDNFTNTARRTRRSGNTDDGNKAYFSPCYAHDSSSCSDKCAWQSLVQYDISNPQFEACVPTDPEIFSNDTDCVAAQQFEITVDESTVVLCTVANFQNSVSSPVTPAPPPPVPEADWSTCNWFQSNYHTHDEIELESVQTPAECIALATTANCDIANLNIYLDGSCWCQYLHGQSPTTDNDPEYRSCVLSPPPPPPVPPTTSTSTTLSTLTIVLIAVGSAAAVTIAAACCCRKTTKIAGGMFF